MDERFFRLFHGHGSDGSRGPPAKEQAMMTVLTTSTLRSGSEEDWDAAMRERFESAQRTLGWVSGQLLTPEDDPLSRVIVGTWNSREAWMAWHDDPAFLEKRTLLERLESAPNVTRWFHVVADARAGG